jgi:hypothetical protein
MNPGRELDRLVAEKVFGHKVVEFKPFGRIDWAIMDEKAQLVPVPRYSEHIACAWELVEHMRQRQVCDVFSLFGPSDESDLWFATFEKKWHGHDMSIKDIYDRVSGVAAPHAICLAALKAVNAI